MCNILLRNLCLAPFAQCATVRKNLNTKMTKMVGNGFNMVFKMIKLTSEAVFHHSKNATVIHHKLALVFSNEQKIYFLSKISSLFLQDNVQEFKCCTLGAPGVRKSLLAEKLIQRQYEIWPKFLFETSWDYRHSKNKLKLSRIMCT